MQSTPELKLILSRHQLRPAKHRGQRFLVSQWVLERIIDAAELTPHDAVVEIGPGLGALTTKLAERAGHTVVVEKDGKILNILKETIPPALRKRIHFIHADILKITIKGLVGRRAYKIVANIPYEISSPLLWKVLRAESKPSAIVLTVQKEFAGRLVAKPPQANALSVFIAMLGKPEIVAELGPEAFWPRPKVRSAIVKIAPISGRFFERTASDEKAVLNILRRAFARPKKKLRNTLVVGQKTHAAALKPRLRKLLEQRPATLNVDEWAELARALHTPS